MNTPTKRTALAALVILVLTLAAYSNSFDNSFHFDDQHQIVQNHSLRSFDIKKFFLTGEAASHEPGRKGYRPVTYLSFAFSYALAGYKVWAYHLFNVLLHCVNALLVYLLVARLLGAKEKKADSTALLAALIFALHPIQTHAVTYISGRAVLLASFFGLSSFYCFLRWRTGDARPGWAMASAALFTAGMLSKEFAVATIALMLSYDLTVKDKKGGWSIYVPLLALIDAFIATRRYMMGPPVQGDDLISVSSYMLSEARVLPLYARLMFLPVNQNADYAFKPLFSPDAVLAVSAVLVLGALYLLYLHRKSAPEAVFFFSWFLIALVPESSFYPIADIAQEYRLYFPSVGIITGTAVALLHYAERQPVLRRVIAVSVLAVFAVLTFNRNVVWDTERTLWADVLKKSPYSARAHFSFGNALMDEKDYAAALKEYSNTLDIDPVFPERFGLKNNRGLCYVLTGRLDQAESEFLAAAEENPTQSEPFYNLGKLYNSEGRYDEAAVFLLKAVSLNRGYAPAHVELARAYSMSGRKAQAEYEMRTATSMARE